MAFLLLRLLSFRMDVATSESLLTLIDLLIIYLC